MVKAHLVLGAPLKEPLNLDIQGDAVFIGIDRGALYLVDEGVQPDLAIGDFDSISSEEKERIKKHSKLVEHFQSEKDDTDTELGLIQTVEQFHPDSIVIHNWAGGRLDHFISILFLVVQPRFYSILSILSFVDRENTICFYHPGEHVVRKEKDKEYLSYIGMTQLKGLTLHDVKYPLNKADYSYPAALISNEFIKDTARFSFKEGILAVIQSKDRK